MSVISRLFSRQPNAASDRTVFITMVLFGLTGLGASFVLAVEEFHLLQNPDAVLSCSINLVLNCASVMKTWQASVFGFPNMFLGLMGFPLVLMIASLGLSKVSLPRWFAVAMEGGIFLATLFAYWLFFNSVYAIQILCPWCLVVTFSMTILLAAATIYTIRHNTFKLSSTASKRLKTFVDKGYYQMLVVAWVVALIAVVILKFGDGLFA